MIAHVKAKDSTRKIFPIHVKMVLAAAARPCREIDSGDIVSLRLRSLLMVKAVVYFPD
jgi:hypothetical protein